MEVEEHAFVPDVRGHHRWGRHKEQPSGVRCADSGLYKIPDLLDLMNMRNCACSLKKSRPSGPFLFCDPSVVSGFWFLNAEDVER